MSRPNPLLAFPSKGLNYPLPRVAGTGSVSNPEGSSTGVALKSIVYSRLSLWSRPVFSCKPKKTSEDHVAQDAPTASGNPRERNDQRSFGAVKSSRESLINQNVPSAEQVSASTAISGIKSPPLTLGRSSIVSAVVHKTPSVILVPDSHLPRDSVGTIVLCVHFLMLHVYTLWSLTDYWLTITEIPRSTRK